MQPQLALAWDLESINSALSNPPYEGFDSTRLPAETVLLKTNGNIALSRAEGHVAHVSTHIKSSIETGMWPT